MNKRLIRLTESDLHRIVKESVNRVLSEENTPWQEHLNSTYNTPESQYQKQGINDVKNIDQIKNYIVACSNIIKRLENYTAIQDNEEIWQGFVHLESYISSLYTYIVYELGSILNGH